MGGVLDWSAVPLLVELVGIDAPELVLHQLVLLRNGFSQEA